MAARAAIAKIRNRTNLIMVVLRWRLQACWQRAASSTASAQGRIQRGPVTIHRDTASEIGRRWLDVVCRRRPLTGTGAHIASLLNQRRFSRESPGFGKCET